MNTRTARALAAAGVLAMTLSGACLAAQGPIPVEIIESDGGFRLLRGGEPYEIHGAGLEFANIGMFASHGGNSIRTWRTDNAQNLLDEALAHGVTVLMCIEIGRERHGFDYDDLERRLAGPESARIWVLCNPHNPVGRVWSPEELAAMAEVCAHHDVAVVADEVKKLASQTAQATEEISATAEAIAAAASSAGSAAPWPFLLSAFFFFASFPSSFPGACSASPGSPTPRARWCCSSSRRSRPPAPGASSC